MAPTRPEPLRIAFLGFGLIGGSVAMALRANAREAGHGAAIDAAPAPLRIVAWTPSGRGPAIGLERGIVDEVASSAGEATDGADVVVLAAPPLAVLDLLALLGDAVPAAGTAGLTRRRGPVVTDVASTKAVIVARAEELGVRFVGGHPMAGREVTGVEAASAALFTGRPWVVVQGHADPDAVEMVERLALWTGAEPVRMTAEAHDAAVGAISHLPLVVAAALVEAVAAAGDWPVAQALAATGWRDTTRLAAGDPDMGAGILATNADAVAERLVALRAAVDAWIAALRPPVGSPDAAALRDRLAWARAALGAGPDRRP